MIQLLADAVVGLACCVLVLVVCYGIGHATDTRFHWLPPRLDTFDRCVLTTMIGSGIIAVTGLALLIFSSIGASLRLG